ncbi:MAG: hypothetical protein AAF602_11985, partial [Myxococcota bacterium]
MNRRSFLHALGLGGGATAAGCNWDDNRYYTPIEQVIPYLAHPIQTTPGAPSYFSTTVGRGPHAWPVTAVHREGRVLNVSGNQVAYTESKNAKDQRTLHRGVSSGNLFELQRHYSPDRFQEPSRPSGTGREIVSFDDARTALTDAVVAARAAGKRVVYVGPYESGAIVDALEGFADEAIFWEPIGHDNEMAAARALFGDDEGQATLPRYDLAGANFVLSFGAPFLNDAWGGPGLESDFAMARDANYNHSVARFAAVTPLRDLTAANADDWYGCRPGSEAQVALAIAKLVAEKGDFLTRRDEEG